MIDQRLLYPDPANPGSNHAAADGFRACAGGPLRGALPDRGTVDLLHRSSAGLASAPCAVAPLLLEVDLLPPVDAFDLARPGVGVELPAGRTAACAGGRTVVWRDAVG